MKRFFGLRFFVFCSDADHLPSNEEGRTLFYLPGRTDEQVQCAQLGDVRAPN